MRVPTLILLQTVLLGGLVFYQLMMKAFSEMVPLAPVKTRLLAWQLVPTTEAVLIIRLLDLKPDGVLIRDLLIAWSVSGPVEVFRILLLAIRHGIQLWVGNQLVMQALRL